MGDLVIADDIQRGLDKTTPQVEALLDSIISEDDVSVLTLPEGFTVEDYIRARYLIAWVESQNV